MSVADLADARQRRLIAVNDSATASVVNMWRQMDFAALDASWGVVSPPMVQRVSAAQLVVAGGSSRFSGAVSREYKFAADPFASIPESFVGVDALGRSVEGALFGAVTTTKTAIGSGLGAYQSFHAGATYLATIVKTLIADTARSSDMVAATGKGFVDYVRVVNGGACSRCAILAGKSSYSVAFKRHPACKCTAAPVAGKAEPGLHDTPEKYFESLSPAEQERVFTKAGAQSIRDGADISKVVSARRGATGIGYGNGVGGGRRVTDPRGVFTKTTIGYRANGDPVRVYTTSEGTTARGAFAKAQTSSRVTGSRYSTTKRARLMPESINQIAGNNLALRQAFLRDAGFMDYGQLTGAARNALREADRLAVDRATAKFSNFYLG